MPWSLYDWFNFTEAWLWWGVAVFLMWKVTASTAQQLWAIRIGSVGFVFFGVTDLLEIGTAGRVPLSLWGVKIICGSIILSARYTWRGWRTFRWKDREFLFGIFSLLSVCGLILLQSMVSP